MEDDQVVVVAGKECPGPCASNSRHGWCYACKYHGVFSWVAKKLEYPCSDCCHSRSGDDCYWQERSLPIPEDLDV